MSAMKRGAITAERVLSVINCKCTPEDEVCLYSECYGSSNWDEQTLERLYQRERSNPIDMLTWYDEAMGDVIKWRL